VFAKELLQLVHEQVPPPADCTCLRATVSSHNDCLDIYANWTLHSPQGVSQAQPADFKPICRSAVFLRSPPAAHYNRAAPWSYPMSKADLALRHASIIEQWEAKRLADRGAADTWRLNEIAKLYETCGWTPDEIGAWFGLHGEANQFVEP
jgi:hypothetical protein